MLAAGEVRFTMRRFRENPKAPDIDVLARHYLSRGLAKLPDVTKHAADVGDVEKMGMWELLKLAKSMGANADDVIRATEQAERQRQDYSSKYPGFRGELEFDWTVAFLGQTVTRKARILYEHTPEWEYYDLRKNGLYTGWDSSSYQIEMQAEPEDQDGDGNPLPGTPYWVVLGDITQNEVLPNVVWEAVIDAVDAKCKVEDAERRTAAKDRPAKLMPKSKRRH
jgi:hypothetical protein